MVFQKLMMAAAICASLMGNAIAADRFMYRAVEAPIEVIVDENTQPPAGAALRLFGATIKASISKQFRFDLSALLKTTGIDVSDVTFQISQGSIKPSWLTLSSSGEIGGTPSAEETVTLKVLASGGGKSYEAEYTIQAFPGLFAKKVVNGDATTCAITYTDGAKCWGFGREGQIGSNPVVREAKVALDVHGLDGQVKDIALGQAMMTCAITTADAVKCWGKRIGGASATNVPTVVPGLESGVVSLDIGSTHACAAKSDGSVWCWGDNNYGQLGVSGAATTASAIRASNITAKILKVTAGGYFSCGVTDQNGAVCWGINGAGQLGNGTKSFDRDLNLTPATPQQSQVLGLASGVVGIAAGNSHACATLQSGSVKCWGNNVTGSLGNGSVSSISSEFPLDATEFGNGVAEVDAGIQFTCARYASGSVKCVGWGDAGRLGAGTNAPWEYPNNTMPLPDIQIENGFIELSTSPRSAVALPVLGLQSDVTQISTGNVGGCAVLSSGAVKCWGKNYNAQRGDGTYNDAWTPVSVHDGGS